jgi:cytochrome b subunit of formate dehydrogenase
MRVTRFCAYMALIFACLFIGINYISAQTNDDCLTCHEDAIMSTVKNGKTISLFVNKNILASSVHANVKCASCHTDAAVADFPHPENLKAVECGSCHSTELIQYSAGVHGQASKLNSPYAPGCKDCHGKHDILASSLPASRTYKFNIPALCGKCHREGSPVSNMYDISQTNILNNYSEGIHGVGLLKKGLIVSATCNDCHGNHLILPHSSPNSTVSPQRIASTCMKCHTKIEEVHKKIIKNELWEKKPGAIPACSACHPPHKVSIDESVQNISDIACLKCHETNTVHKTIDGKEVSLTVKVADMENSVHKNISCIKCHSDCDITLPRPCSVTKSVDCSNCHISVADLYFTSGHGKAYLRKEKSAPFCTDCHGTHNIKTRYDDTSPTYRANIPSLCGKCHSENGKAVKATTLKEVNAYADYSLSVHGKGLMEQGLLVSAVCSDCHTSHHILKESDTASSVNPIHISLTCANCHKSIYDQYIQSDHSILKSDGKKKYPTCADCHSAHVITAIDNDKFMTQITTQCGSCHEKLAETYLETYHGKAYLLGYLKAAKCSDCHGSHNILKVDNPNSAVGYKNIVATCRKCHSYANLRFTGYLTHATHNANNVLFYTFWGMTLLLFGVFGFFGLHTLLWIPRSIIEARKKRNHKKIVGQVEYIRRFTRSQRVTHIFVIVSFLTLALTGMTLKFAHMQWARVIASIFGGVRAAGTIHRMAAIITFGYFIFHVFSLLKEKKKKRESLMKFIFGKNSLMFNMQDIRDFIGTVKWFLGLGPRPKYGRWTYWEKFDYMAVFWGVAVIGFSGLILWFPEIFTSVLPGWMINVAQIIHSDEALLAVGFIFTIHFFNTHLRPESFPMDTVIFTGYVSMEEYKADRPREFAELEESGKLEDVKVTTEITSSWLRIVKTAGFIFLSIGLILVLLILFSLITGYY